MEGASGYIIRCLPPHLRFLLFSDKLPSSLTPGSAVETPQAAGLGPCTSLQIRSSPRASFTALLQMLRRHCKTHRSPLHADDAHAEFVSCLGKSHTDSTLSGTDCSHCKSFSLVSLCSRIASFLESDSIPCALPFSSSQGPVRKKLRGREFEQPVTSELTPDQCSHASPSPQREHSLVLFTQHDEHPSAAASNMISFSVSDNELDDSLSLAASDAKELSGSVTDPALLPSSASRNARLRADEELIRVMTKAVNKLGLEWSLPVEPSRSRLDECFLPGHHQALRQPSSPFFSEVYDELMKSSANGPSACGSKRSRACTSTCLEMLTVCQACQFFLPDIRGHHVLIRSDSRSVVSYINHQGSLILKRLCTLANDLLVWAQNNMRSLKAMHVPGKMNQGADMLSRNNVSSEEWMLHPLAVQRIWEIFGRAWVDLFAAKDNSHCPIFFTRSTNALANDSPAFRSMLFPQSLCYSRYSGELGSNGTSWF